MTKKKILKLLESSNEGDVLIGLSFLVGKSLKEILKYFGLKGNYETIAKANMNTYKFYKISEDCVISYLVNIFPAPIADVNSDITDLTKDYETT